MHHHECPEHHVTDYAKIARMERDIWGETFHHEDRHCRCDECVKRAVYRDVELQAQTLHAFGMSPEDAHTAAEKMSHRIPVL